MRMTLSNLSKGEAFPLVIRFSSKSRSIQQLGTAKFQPLQIGSHGVFSDGSLNPLIQFGCKTHKAHQFLKPRKFFSGFRHKSVEFSSLVKARSIPSGFQLRGSVPCCSLETARSFSSSLGKRVGEGSSLTGEGNALPWLKPSKTSEPKGLHRSLAAKGDQTIWKLSTEKMSKESSHSKQEETTEKHEKVSGIKSARSSWEESAETFLGRNGARSMEGREGRNRTANMIMSQENGSDTGRHEGLGEGEEGEEEVIDNPRWDEIRSKFRGVAEVRSGYERPESRRWNKQEQWGRKVWKEATESSVPKMVGEGVYGVGPVLAALSAGRREFYALYVQEGLDFSSNNRKKKDKKGFGKILKMAEKLGLSIKETSKHDLNMIVDNRPHQGLVLDASPLEMVKIKELNPIHDEEEKSTLWVALDEVTDPQNLGAIIRSAYFFGAAGIVLCAKNSAPLSGVVSKASAGSLELMELRYCKNMMQFLVSSAENGWRVLGGSVSSRAVPLNEVLPGAPTILVLGSEGTGLRPLVERSCNQLVRIPGSIGADTEAREVEDVDTTEISSSCSGKEFQSFLAVESLNVSVAAGVLLHHLTGANNGMLSRTENKPTDILQ